MSKPKNPEGSERRAIRMPPRYWALVDSFLPKNPLNQENRYGEIGKFIKTLIQNFFQEQEEDPGSITPILTKIRYQAYQLQVRIEQMSDTEIERLVAQIEGEEISLDDVRIFVQQTIAKRGITLTSPDVPKTRTRSATASAGKQKVSIEDLDSLLGEI